MNTDFSNFYHLVISTNSIYQDIQRRSGLPSSEYWVMFYVYQERCRTAHEICFQTFMSRQTASLGVKNLEKKGWIRSEVSKGNRREKELHTTEAGMAFARKYIFPVAAMEEAAWNGLSADEQESITRTVGRFNEFFRKEVNRQFPEVDTHEPSF